MDQHVPRPPGIQGIEGDMANPNLKNDVSLSLKHKTSAALLMTNSLELCLEKTLDLRKLNINSNQN